MAVTRPKFINDLEAEECIWPPPEEILSAKDFRPYQTWMVDKFHRTPKVLCGAEMGLGKTGAALKVMADTLASGEVKHWLVIAPLRVAEQTWPEQIATWSFARSIPFRVATGDAEQRKAALRLPGRQITIINRENLTWLLRMFGVKGWPFDGIVYDEASRLKSGRLQTGSKAPTELGVLNRIRHRTKRLIELSGTPSPNGLIDLWGPMYAIDQGERLGSSREAYKRRWFREDTYTKEIEPFDHSEAQIMEKVDGAFFSLRETDYLNLPPLVPVDRWVDMPFKALRQYREMEKEYALDLGGEDDSDVIEAANGGVLIGKLLQMANGSIYDEEGRDRFIHDAKLYALDEIIEEAAGRPILCAYSFKFDRDAILKRYKFARLFGESDKDMRDWNAGKIRLLLTHPASAGHGLNFQKGSNIAVWYGLTWSLELYRQFVKRLHRSGQKHDKVFLYRILAERTADRDVLRALLSKGATQDRIMNAVRVRLEAAA